MLQPGQNVEIIVPLVVLILGMSSSLRYQYIIVYFSIKILDVERMVAKSSLPVDMSGSQTDSAAAVDHPVIRTLYDHLEEVTCLAFHPREQLLISGSKDYTVKVFDWSKSSAKKAIKTIQEVEWVRCLGLHPSGDWLVGKFSRFQSGNTNYKKIVGTQHPTIRYYDLNTSACFTSPTQRDHHRGPITDVTFNTDAKIFATSRNPVHHNVIL